LAGTAGGRATTFATVALVDGEGEIRAFSEQLWYVMKATWA
jgi:hypothetical protein